MGRELEKQRQKIALQQDTLAKARRRSGEKLETDAKLGMIGGGHVSIGKLSQTATPTLPQDLTRKDYVDAQRDTRIEDADATVNHTNMNDDTMGGGDGKNSMRSIGRGTGPQVAGSTHTHSSVNFNIDYTDEERRHTIATRAAVRELLAELPEKFEPLRPLVDLCLDLAHQLIDHPETSADDWQEKFETNAAFRHHYLMNEDSAYAAAYRMANDKRLREETPEDAHTWRLVAKGYKKYSKELGDEQWT